MASRQTSKRQAKRTTGARGKQARRSPQAQPRLSQTANDLIGLVLVIVALAMCVALVFPSSAPISHAMGELLVLLFGAGAFLFPAALLVFAATFFLPEEKRIGGRLALGLTLIVFSVLSLFSITYPGAHNDLSLVVRPNIIAQRGGYVGGGIAWGLLKLLGREVGIVILMGTIVAGVVVCGFSISSAVAAASTGVEQLSESLATARERRRERRAQRVDEAYGEPYEPYDAFEVPFEEKSGRAGAQAVPETTFLGNRKRSVLTRSQRPQANLLPLDEAPAPEQKTTLLRKGLDRLSRKSAKDELDDATIVRQKAIASDEAPDVPVSAPDPVPLSQLEPQEGAIPDFLTAVALATDELSTQASEVAVAEAAPTRLSRKRKSAAAPETAPTKNPASKKPKRPTSKAEAPVGRASRRKSDERASARPGDGDDTYELPPFDMLASNPNGLQSASSRAELEETMGRLQDTLREFGLSSRVVDYVAGPIVTTFRIEMGEGERVNRIKNLEDDIALTLAAEKVRIFAPIAGTSYVGIEIPNKTRSDVFLGDVLPHAKGGPLEVAIGRDSAGRPIVADIAKMPHMLVAGTTGSGKSVLINSMIMSLLMRTTPKQVRLIMVDPKRVEFSSYNGLPHLYVPVVTEPRQAASALQWAVSEMERRLKVFERANARNISVYNEMCVSGKLAEQENPPEPMPYLVVIIDELSDLMMVAGKDVEASIVRIAQLARAAGIHLVIATQRPSANVVTGLIKSNIDTRAALKVSSGIDSRVILDETGAERMLGYGDMLFKDRGLAPKRVLGCYTSDDEIEAVVDHIRSQAEPDYHEEILSAVVPGQAGGGASALDEEDDPLIWEAAQIVVESQLGSTSGLQRRLKVGYARAGRIMDMLESKGVVGPASGSKPREVLLDEEGLEDLRVLEQRYKEV